METVSNRSIVRLAAQGAREATRWHLFGREEKNQAAAEETLDQIALSGELGTKFTENLQQLRTLGTGLSPKARLKVDQTLLHSLASRAASFASQGVHTSLAVLEDVLLAQWGGKANESDTHQLGQSGDRVFKELVKTSKDPILNMAARLEHSSPLSKIYFAQNFYLDPEEFGQDAADILRRTDEEDQPVMHAFLADQLKPFRSDQDGEKANQMLAALAQLPAGEDRDFAADIAFELYERGGSAKDMLDNIRSFGVSAQSETVLKEIENSLNPQLELDFASRPATQLELAF